MVFRFNKDLGVLLIGRLLQIFISLFSLRISTSIIPETELGLVYYTIAVQSFFALLLINPVGQYFNRQINRWYKAGTIFERFVRQSLFILSVAIIASLILSLFDVFGLLELSLNLILITGGLVFAQSLNQTVLPMLNMLGRRGAFVGFNLVTSLLSALFSFLMIIYVENSAASWLLGIILGTMVVNFIASYWFRNLILELPVSDFEASSDTFKNILYFTLPIALSTAFMWFLGLGYRVLIEKYNGLEFLAILGTGLAVSNQIFAIAESLLTQYLLPFLYKNIESANEEERISALNTYLALIVPLYISLALFLTFSMKYIFPFLVAQKYHEAYIFAVYGTWVELFRTLTNGFAITAQIEKRTGNTVLPFVIGASCLFIALTAQHYWALDVDIMKVLIVANFIVLILMIFSMTRYLNFSIPYRQTCHSAIVIVPSLLYFYFWEIDADVSLNVFLYLSLGTGLYMLGVVVGFYRLKND